MPTLASILFAWSAIHTFVAVYSLALYARLRGGYEYAGFSAASFAIAVYTFGAALLVLAPDLRAAMHAQRLQFMGLCTGLPGFMLLLYSVIDYPEAPVIKISVAWTIVGLVLNASGLFFDADVAATSAWRHPQVALLPAGIAFAFAGIAITAWSLAEIIWRGGLRNRDMGLILIFGIPSAVAWAYDTAVRTFGLREPFLLEHVALVSSLGISYVLLGRFARLDDDLRDRTFELKRSYEELQLVQEELVRKEQLAAVGELSAVIANEVKSPLEALRAAVDALAEGHLASAEHHDLLGTLDEETDRLNRLVRDLLAYARPMEPQYEPLEVRKLVEAATAGLDVNADGVQVDLDVHEGPPTVQGDPDLLAKALAHIVDNALQAMSSGGVLTIRSAEASVDGGFGIALSFHDTGEGMDQLVREKARDPFFTTRPSGTGLGLAIVERVIQAHGGRVELHSSYGRGTTVTVLLPGERRSSLPPQA